MKRITSKIDLLENLLNFGREKESMATSEYYYNTPDSPRNQGKTQGNLTINSHLLPSPPPHITKSLPSPRPVRRNTLEEIQRGDDGDSFQTNNNDTAVSFARLTSELSSHRLLLHNAVKCIHTKKIQRRKYGKHIYRMIFIILLLSNCISISTSAAAYLHILLPKKFIARQSPDLLP